MPACLCALEQAKDARRRSPFSVVAARDGAAVLAVDRPVQPWRSPQRTKVCPGAPPRRRSVLCRQTGVASPSGGRHAFAPCLRTPAGGKGGWPRHTAHSCWARTVSPRPCATGHVARPSPHRPGGAAGEADGPGPAAVSKGEQSATPAAGSVVHQPVPPSRGRICAGYAEAFRARTPVSPEKRGCLAHCTLPANLLTPPNERDQRVHVAGSRLRSDGFTLSQAQTTLIRTP